ncbi:Fic family protein [Campylobacter sp. RM12642]|uniref:Fic family protein n=1 Tax=unclassified Campylobacter TaxID=2593542 RepID=UPI001DA84BAF|nr:Fic family protein [Campylobacter sp. RM12642]MBZ8008108.1 Fic family protein [Campylobacter sp. RM9334]
MKNKFHMSLEYNICLAKRNIVDNIYKSARLEGINVTFPQVEAIYNGASVGNLKVDDIVAINNLKYAWYVLFDTISYPEIDFAYICKINKTIGANLIYQSGYIRQFDVAIGGTTYKPKMPYKEEIIEELNEIQKITNTTQRAITLMLYLMRKQIFSDGNKRTAILCANKVLISNGAGLVNIPVGLINEFKEKLIKYYETNEMKDIMDFTYKNCIDGFNSVEPSIEEKLESEKNDEMFNQYIAKSYKNKLF